MENFENVKMKQPIENLRSLFKDKILIVPPYQRAYVWKKKQLDQFVSDLLITPNNYYYGHFILERKDQGCYEIIDGQQRITTLILLLLVYRKWNSRAVQGFNNFLDKFRTVEYDQQSFETLKANLPSTNYEWNANNLGLGNEEQQTVSIGRIIYALNYFRKLLKKDRKLDLRRLSRHVNTLMEAEISMHIVDKKAVAVQILELQNLRGVKPTLIEKVKGKLLKVAYLEGSEDAVLQIHACFASIHKHEQRAKAISFRAGFTLEESLLHHLRTIDDGKKLFTSDINSFSSPLWSSDQDKNILNYINQQLREKANVIDYAIGLAQSLKKTIDFLFEYLLDLDNDYPLIGDVFMLEREFALELLILQYHKSGNANLLKDSEYLKLLEKLLFTRQLFQGLLMQTDKNDFIYNIANDRKSIGDYIISGLKMESMVEQPLSKSLSIFLESEENKMDLLKGCSSVLRGSSIVSYLLYKYELSINPNRLSLQEIMEGYNPKTQILSRHSWKKIIDTNDEGNLELTNKIYDIIEGLGNLILVSESEYCESTRHPMDKYYHSCAGGSYEIHNTNRAQWKDPNNWEKIIMNRGEKIYEFLCDFIRN